MFETGPVWRVLTLGAVFGATVLDTTFGWAQAPPAGAAPPPIVTGGMPPREPGAEGEDEDGLALRAVMDCILSARRNRYYPFRAKLAFQTRDSKTGAWAKGEPRYLDPLARWDEDGMTFVALGEVIGPQGGIDLTSGPQAVVSVPNSAIASAAAGESSEFNVSFLFRWWPDTVHKRVPVRLTRSMTYNYKYETQRPIEVFTTPSDNPRASKIEFTIYFTWDCEQEFKSAVRSGERTRADVAELVAAEVNRRRQAKLHPDGPPDTGGGDPPGPPGSAGGANAGRPAPGESRRLPPRELPKSPSPPGDPPN